MTVAPALRGAARRSQTVRGERSHLLKLTTLASGSSGNCALLSDGETHLLLDAGISCRRICAALAGLDIPPESLSGVLITHEHADHISGLATLHKRFRLPVYTSPGTARQLCYRIAALEDVVRPCAPGSSFTVGGLDVETFPISHDAAEPMGFAVSDGERKAALVTDLGVVTEAVRRGMAGARLVLVEANHDPDWVRSGPYPYYLQARILGEKGHLSNEDGGALALAAADGGARTVVLAHLSRENNTPQRAYDAVSAILDAHGARENGLTLAVAPRDQTGPVYTI